jgi:ABC-type xylose transport system permease subunit
MTWIVFALGAWLSIALVAALLLGRAIGQADGFAADATAPNFVVDAPMAHA